MKITIDTAHDSHEEIRKVIKMLHSLVSDARTNYAESSDRSSSDYDYEDAQGSYRPPRQQNIFDSSDPAPSGMFDMFNTGTSQGSSHQESPVQQSEPHSEHTESSPMMNMFDISSSQQDSQEEDDDDMFSFDLETY